MNVDTECSRKIQGDGFGKFAVKTCYFSRRKGPNPRMECDDLTSVWLSLIGSMVPHGLHHPKVPKSRESHAMYFSQIERPFSLQFFLGVFIYFFEILNVR